MGGCANNQKFTYLTPDPKAKEVDGETIVHVNKSFQDVDKYIKDIENITILGEITKAVLKHPNNDALGWRKYKSETDLDSNFTFLKYKEVFKMANNMAKNIALNKLYQEMTFNDEEGEWNICGIFARNCIEWTITDLALQMNDITSVTFYSTLGSESFDHIFEQTNVSTVFISPESISKLVEFHKKYKFKTFKNIVVFDLTCWMSKDKTEVDVIKNMGINVYYFSELIRDPSEDYKLTPPRPESVVTICYTSGTTSLPKGAKLTHRGFSSQLTVNEDSGMYINEKDVILCYLPLAHVMERLNILHSLLRGCKIGFISGTDIKKYLMDDLFILKPTIFVAVPRIIIGFHQKVLEGFSKLTGCAKSMAETALKVKRENYDKSGEITHWYYDSLVFSKIKAKFGGKVRLMLVGSAPIPKDISKDIKLLMCCPLQEGYGMTELHGASNATSAFDLNNHNVGGVIRSLRLKLVDNKTLNYHSKTEIDGQPSPTGEICYKGPSVFPGYFRDIENTKSTIDSDGWLHTGDIGRIDPVNNGLKIIDRVKEIFKLSQGEYIAPAKLEAMYCKCPLVLQICIYGNSEKSFILAIVVVNRINCSNYLIESGVLENPNDVKVLEKIDLTPYFNNEKLHMEFRKQFDEIAKQQKFSSLEKPQKFIFTHNEFTIDNNLLTPTHKFVRKNIQLFFQDEINKAYL